jgi:SlyX protein
MPNLEKRIEELEIKFSYQQELVESLNLTVTKQWDEIDLLKKTSKRLQEEVLNLKDNSAISSDDEAPPPHY